MAIPKEQLPHEKPFQTPRFEAFTQSEGEQPERGPNGQVETFKKGTEAWQNQFSLNGRGAQILESVSSVRPLSQEVKRRADSPFTKEWEEFNRDVNEGRNPRAGVPRSDR